MFNHLNFFLSPPFSQKVHKFEAIREKKKKKTTENETLTQKDRLGISPRSGQPWCLSAQAIFLYLPLGPGISFSKTLLNDNPIISYTIIVPCLS